MPSLMQSLGVDRLSAAEQLQLVGEILDNLNDEATVSPLTDAQRHELDRRLALLEADPDRGSPWEEVEARVLARLRR